jgi:hypothetical protein
MIQSDTILPPTDDAFETRHQNAKTLLQNGHIGYEVLRNKISDDSLLEELADLSNVDPAVQNTFRAGLGLVFGGALRTDQARDLAKMEAEIKRQGLDGFNWAEFADLLGNK